jgi:hypothetical protein
MSFECWGAVLGDCAGGISREHLISDGIFDGAMVSAYGLKWCKDRPVEISLASAVSKVLCKRHNEGLSAFDAEASRLSRFLSTNVLDDPLSEAQVTLRGPLLEKWALKTFINLAYIGALDPEHHARVQPDEDLVKYVYEGTSVPSGVGLYFVAGSISNSNFNVGLSWNGIRNLSRAGAIVGMTFTLNTVRFVVSGEAGPAEAHLAKIGLVNDVDYSRATIYYRPPDIALLSKTAGQKTIYLEW